MGVSLVWSTPDGDTLIAEMARVSNPSNRKNAETAPKLIAYLIKHKHWSPFEMVNACVEITCARDVGRQLLRHRSFSFQEFSGRYAAYEGLLPPREARAQDPKNRQNSVEFEAGEYQIERWRDIQTEIATRAEHAYSEALDMGIAKELARSVLPEGLTPTRIFMNGNLRSWMHFYAVRCADGVQKETWSVASDISHLLVKIFPAAWAAFINEGT